MRLTRFAAQIVFVVVVLAFAMPAQHQTFAQSGILTVDVTDSQGTISPYVYGANYGPWAIVSMEMQNAAAESGITHFRFPGGNWGDDNFIQRSQLDLFMLQAQNWGMVPSISVNLENGTPEQAAELVRYANVEKGWNILHWSIGNEPDLFPDGYTVEQYNEEWRAMALAMRAVDPNIILIGPEVSQFPDTVEGDTYNNVRREWVRSFLEANGDLVDIVAIHRYPFPLSLSSPPTTIEQLRDNAAAWDVLIDNLRTVIREAVGSDMPMAVTEASSHWNQPIGGEATADSHFHAVWWADVLGRFIRQRLEIVDYFAFSTFDTAYGLLARYAPRPTYYVYQLYQYFGDELVASASTAEHVSITAALTDDNILTLMITNMNDEPVSVPLTIDGAQINGMVERMVLDPDRQAQALDPQEFTDGDALELTAYSVTLLRIPITPN